MLAASAAILLNACFVTSVRPFYFASDVVDVPDLVGSWDARIREGLGIDMPMDKLFVLPTLDGQARELEAVLDAREHREHEEVMAVLAEMSDEEAEELLREMDPTPS